ncbi:bifunctional arginine demethylase and lysyl-hydroxylase JMJD6-like [Bolinopsis microptera]|uniref:bifunctional arginine demethylase and lysyl-hydroxylase JMJD6-like n=1 Tax=Bolinopsis microptera TaxID=2820187 RepID=UPI00307A9A91
MERLDFPELTPRALKRINRARHKAREELKDQKKDWVKNNYHETCDKLLPPVVDTVPRVDARSLSCEEFRNKYEIPRIPIVLTHLMEDWPAMTKWTMKKLVKKYRNQSFKVGEDNRGNSVKLKLKYYKDYVSCNKDDSPLYVFDGNYGEHRKKCQFLEDYKVPEYFAEDLFRLVGEKRRPPYRWVVFGPKRSGTSVHIDPLGTHAWNALVSGYKRWILFPTHTARWLLKQKLPDSEAITWFKFVHPQTDDPNWPEDCKPIECLQGPGEMMFVPGGWWHAVLNVSDTVAVTHNYVSTANFAASWHKTARGRPKLSKKWLAQLREHRPDLAKIADDTDLSVKLAEQSDSSSNGSTSSSSSSSSSCSTCLTDSNSDNDRSRPVSRKKTSAKKKAGKRGNESEEGRRKRYRSKRERDRTNYRNKRPSHSEDDKKEKKSGKSSRQGSSENSNQGRPAREH